MELGKLIKRRLVEYMTSGLIVVMVLAGNRAVEVVRKLHGASRHHKRRFLYR